MENKSKLNTVLLVIIIIILVAGGSVYYFGKSGSKQEVKVEKNYLDDIRLNSNDSSKNILNSEESTVEVFTRQPGAIKSIVVSKDEDGFERSNWTVSIDLLSGNPDWVPGGDGGFFINQNTRIRNLNISYSTKIINCTTQYSDYASGFKGDLLSFINYAQNKINNPKETGEFGYTAYFDINGTNITAIYEQCLP